MGSKIEWTEETVNAVVGCSKISPGCNNCYAERMAGRLANMGQSVYQNVVLNEGLWDEKSESHYKGVWNGETQFVQSALDKISKWKKPRTIFMCSMGDLFHESTKLMWINIIWMIMHKESRHTFLILTKRPERMVWMLQHMDWGALPNVWLGVTAENQEQADKRIPILLQIPAVKRFVSIEPMLGPVDINKYLKKELQAFGGNGTNYFTVLDWVICGGESGPGARPMHPVWANNRLIWMSSTFWDSM